MARVGKLATVQKPSKRRYASAGRISCFIALTIAIAWGIVWNVRFGIADLLSRRNQPDDTRLAMRLLPANPAYPAQLADEIYAIDPASAKSLLQRAVKLNRYDASSRIQLGLLHESEGDLPQAEEALLQAAKVDTTFLPSWSLANFYFRHDNTARFWYWARIAAQMAPDDATPLFRLAWYVSPNAREIADRLQMKRAVIQIQFVNFLMTQGDPSAVNDAAWQLLKTGKDGNTETLLSVCEWLIEHQHPDLALPLWNELSERHQIPYAPLSAGSADTVTNSRFGKSPLSLGFDWHLMTVDGVSSFLNVNPNALGFEFSGEEPDNFLIMNQTAPVQPKNQYVLAIEYATASIPPGSGIEWLVTDPASGAVLTRTGSLSTEQGGEARACFVAPDGTKFVNLALHYQRQAGTVRVEGKLSLKRVSLSGAVADECSKGEISAFGAVYRAS
jgi:tetratricopeptide (TPR) repeat protein